MKIVSVRDRLQGIRVVCFDVDGTLVEHPENKTVWQILNGRFLEGDAVNGRRFQDFKEGRISYPEWVKLDVEDWIARDVRRDQIESCIRAELAPVPGALDTIRALRARGYRLAVISGTIDATLAGLLGELPFERVYTNRIHFGEEGRITGWDPTPFDVWGKPEALDRIAGELGLAREQCAFVGDAWNDLSVLRHAGVGIAFRPKGDDVREAADIVIEEGPLTALLELFGGVTP